MKQKIKYNYKQLKIKEKKSKELKNIDKNKTLKATDEISKKYAKANRILFAIKKVDETLRTQNSIVQKLMERKITLIVFCFH